MIDNINQSSQILQSDDDGLRVMFYTMVSTPIVQDAISKDKHMRKLLN